MQYCMINTELFRNLNLHNVESRVPCYSTKRLNKPIISASRTPECPWKSRKHFLLNQWSGPRRLTFVNYVKSAHNHSNPCFSQVKSNQYIYAPLPACRKSKSSSKSGPYAVLNKRSRAYQLSSMAFGFSQLGSMRSMKEDATSFLFFLLLPEPRRIV